MKTTSKATAKYFGEFGLRGGSEVVTIVAPAGKVREVTRLWSQLDDADAIEQDEIIVQLETLGAVRRDS